MFEDDRGRLLQIGEWLGDVEKGLADSNPLEDEILPWRLSRVEQSRAGLSASYLAQNPELSRLGLPDLDRALAALYEPRGPYRDLAYHAIEVFAPLLANLPAPPVRRPAVPNPASRRDQVLVKLKELEPLCREKGITALYLFGSMARREDGPNSDVDLAFDDTDGTTSFDLFNMSHVRNEVERHLGLSVDLVDLNGLRADMKERVEADLVRIF
jgi:predicted nucleotidyltransferase